MRKVFATLSALVLSAAMVMAQGVITFKESIHDFGDFKENLGVQTYRFELKNTGDSALVITNVQASCGCTTPSWSKEPIAPGKKGFVEAAYNPAGRPGPFNKTLSVVSNSGKSPVTVLTIKGVVKEKDKTIADIYPRKVGDFRVQSEYLNVGFAYPTKIMNSTFKIYNDTNKTITFKPIKQQFNHIKISIEPKELKPHQEGQIKIEYDAKARNDWGYMNDMFELETSGGYTDKVNMYVVATIQEEARKNLTPEELKAAPRLTFEGGKKEYDFGELTPGDVVNYKFVFKNTGGSNLLIRKSKASCGCTASEPTSKDLAPGATSEIKVTFNSTGKHDGDQSQSVTIYTNDPTEPTQYLTIKAKINSKKEAAAPMLATPPSILSTKEGAKDGAKMNVTTVPAVSTEKTKEAATPAKSKTKVAKGAKAELKTTPTKKG